MIPIALIDNMGILLVDVCVVIKRFELLLVGLGSKYHWYPG